MTRTNDRPCPVCGSALTATVGPILHPRPALVAGVELDLGTTEYLLKRCERCQFQFKDPPIPAERLIDCYERATADNWEEEPDPWYRRFDLLRDLTEKHSVGRRVLDIGCFNGALLKYLGDDWQKFGVEPSHAAAELARARGVTILGPGLEQLDPAVEKFDAILLIDVAEHVGEPIPFFERIAALLAPQGILIVLTGDTQSAAWRWQRNAYWYCSLPEHVSFYSRATFQWIGERSHIHEVDYRRLCHKRMPLRRWCSDFAKSVAYLAGRKVGGLGFPPLRRLFVERRGPSIQSAQDHLAVVYRKP